MQRFISLRTNIYNIGSWVYKRVLTAQQFNFKKHTNGLNRKLLLKGVINGNKHMMMSSKT